MNHIDTFKGNTTLIAKYGMGDAHLIWVMGLYLDNSNLEELASECVTEGWGDKKIDFIKLDVDNKKIVFAQGYYAKKKAGSAPSNKASDLNTAAAWLFSGSLELISSPLKEIIADCRAAIQADEIEQIDILYVHNLSESVSVERELKTVANHLKSTLSTATISIEIISRELGLTNVEAMFDEQTSKILVKEKIECPAKLEFEITEENWSSGILSIPGTWLREQFLKYNDKLFSANYRGFLGIDRRRKINHGIKTTAEFQPKNFWAYNNGITILTQDYSSSNEKTILHGISIINGAQTTGSLGSLDINTDLSSVRVLARIIKCTDENTIESIIRFNNTQNKITTWDKFSNDPIQKNIMEQFKSLNHNYSLKRGFSDQMGEIGIENVIQPLVAILGNFAEANRGKNGLFDSDNSYKSAFENVHARHILFVYCLNGAINERRNQLKLKKEENTIIPIEEKQLTLLRSFKFKYFYVSIFGKCLEILLNTKITSIKQVGFKEEFAQKRNYPLNSLIVDLLPVVNLVLIHTSISVNGKDFTELLEEGGDSIDKIANQVSGMLYASIYSGTNFDIERFRKIISYNIA